MTKIRKKSAYPVKENPEPTDFMVGTDNETGETISFEIQSIINAVNGSIGMDMIQYQFSDGSNPAIEYTSKGYFFTDNNNGKVGEFNKLILNKQSLSSTDLSPLFQFLGSREDITIEFKSPSNPNIFFTFKITAFEDNTDYFEFTVVQLSGLFIGELENESIYSFYWDVLTDLSLYTPNGGYTGTAQDLKNSIDAIDISSKEDKSNKQNSLETDGTGQKYTTVDSVNAGLNIKLDKGTYTGNASDLKSDIDNIYQPNVLITYTNPTRSINTFTFPSGGYTALINKVQYTNSSSFVTLISPAATSNKRTDLIYITTGGIIGKKIGVESTTVAVRPEVNSNEVAIAFINVFETVIDTPTPVTQEISIQDAQGIQKFLISDYIRFDGADLDTPTKTVKISPFTPFTVFVDTVNGNDTTGQIENSKRPFKTDTAAYAALPANNGTLWKILFIDTGFITRVMHNFPRNRPLTIECMSDGGQFNFSGITGEYLNAEDLTINIPRCDYNFTSAVSTCIGSLKKFTLIARTITVGATGTPGNNGHLLGALDTSTIECVNFNVTTSTTPIAINGNVKITGQLTLPSGGGFCGNYSLRINLDINVLNHPVNGDYTFFTGAGANTTGSFTIGSFIGSGTGNIYLVNNYTRTITVVFKNTVIPSTLNFSLGTNMGLDSIRYVSGTLASGSKISAGSLNTSPLVTMKLFFQNFEGTINAFDGTRMDISIFNSVFYTAAEFLNGTDFKSITIAGVATFIQTVPGALIINQTVVKDILINGFLKTNAKYVGINVNSIYNANTFKEELNKVVVRSKYDLLRPLNSMNKYIIDVNITDFAANEQISIPATGLTFGGNGIENSILGKTVAGLPLFKSDTGGSGNIIFSDIKITTPLGSVFDLQDSDGSHAIELNDVNIENCLSWGKIKGYRQLTGQTIGCYGCQDGLMVSGSWNGFTISKLHVRSFSSTGTLFKKDTDTSFSNRFFLDSTNLSGASGIKLLDFDTTNFIKDKTLQISDSIFEVNNIISESNSSGLIPNISPYSLKSYFTNNRGIKNSDPFLLYYALINQSGTSDPTKIVLGNNTIGDIVWTRSTNGFYFGNLPGAFPEGKTHLSITPSSSSGSYAIFRNTDDQIVIRTQDNSTVPFTDADSKLFNNSIEIKVANF